MTNTLKNHRRTWKKKKILRDIYFEWYRKIEQDLIPGKTLEIGSGIGNFKEFKPEIVSSDIDPQPWLDAHFDAHEIPFKKGSFSNVVMIDVLHHMGNPIKFLDEANRILRTNGRLIMIEPFPSFFSLIVYRLFHPEPFIFQTDYFDDNLTYKNKTPWESNQAIPYLIFFKGASKFIRRFKNKFRVEKKEKFSFITHPLSGGFEHNQLVPNFLIPILNAIEYLLTPFNSFLAFHCYIVLKNIKK